MAASHGSVSARRKRWRLSRYSAARSRASERVAEVMASLAAIEPRRLDQKNGNRHRVDEKSTGIGEQILSGRIEEAEQLDGEPAAERGKPRPYREGQREQAVDIDADRFRHAPVVNSGTDLGADIGALECVPEHDDEHDAERDQKGPIAREITESEVDVALQPVGQRHRFRNRPVEISRGGDRHKGKTDGEQHLLEVGGSIESAIEAALEHDARCSDDNRRNDERGNKADTERAGERDDDIAAGHRESAVRQVHETHQPHRDRKADGGDEQEHGVSQPVEQDADGNDRELRHEPHLVLKKTPPRLYARRRCLLSNERTQLPQRPSFNSLHSSLTALVVPRTLTPSLPSVLRMTSMACSSCTMSRVEASIVTVPRGPLPVQPFIASITFWPSPTLPSSFLIVSKMACMVSQPAA